MEKDEEREKHNYSIVLLQGRRHLLYSIECGQGYTDGKCLQKRCCVPLIIPIIAAWFRVTTLI